LGEEVAIERIVAIAKELPFAAVAALPSAGLNI